MQTLFTVSLQQNVMQNAPSNVPDVKQTQTRRVRYQTSKGVDHVIDGRRCTLYLHYTVAVSFSTF